MGAAETIGGALTVVGTGIGFRGQLIPAAEAAIREADKVMYQVDDPLTARWLHDLNSNAENLAQLPTSHGALSPHVYEAMAEHILESVVAGLRVCYVTYGHPGMYQHTAHRSVELVRGFGLSATMVPGISAFDCMIADLGIEIGPGCQLLDATALVMQRKLLDPSSSLVLFQIGIFGNPYYRGDRPAALRLLGERLRETWGADFEAVLYEAAMSPATDATVHRVRLSELEVAPITERTLVYLSPTGTGAPDVVAAAEIAAGLAVS